MIFEITHYCFLCFRLKILNKNLLMKLKILNFDLKFIFLLFPIKLLLIAVPSSQKYGTCIIP